MEVTEEGGVEESRGGKDDAIVAVLKDVGAEGVEEVLLVGLAKESSAGGARARGGGEGSGEERDVWKAEGGSDGEECGEASGREEFVGSVPLVKVFVDERFERPGIGFATSEDDELEIGAVRGGVAVSKSWENARMEADLVAIHPPAADSIDES